MKKYISIVLIVLMSAVMVSAYAEDTDSSMSFNQAKLDLIKNSRTLEKLRHMERKAQLDYNNSVTSSKYLENTIDTLKKFGMLGYYDDMMLTMQKDFIPEQLKYVWLLLHDNRTVTQRSLILGLRDIYLGLHSAYNDVEVKKDKLEIAKKKYDQDKLKFEHGLISELDFKQSEYDYLRAQSEVNKAERNKENMLRTFNSYVGYPLDIAYNQVIFDENIWDIELKPIDYYIDKALNERLEIKDINEQIRLNELRRKIIEDSKANLVNDDARIEYERVLIDRENLELKLERTKVQIEKEIKDAYADILKSRNELVNLKRTINIQQDRLKDVKVQYEQGLLPSIILEELQLSIKELENTYRLLVYSYNTKKMKLEYSSGIGPAY